MPRPAPILSSSQPDPGLLDRLAVVQKIFILIVLALAGTLLCVWLVHPLYRVFPGNWLLMKPNAALVSILIAICLILQQPRRSPRMIRVARFLAVAVVLISATVLLEHIFNHSLGIDTLLAADERAPHPGRMAPQAAMAFLLLGVEMLLLRARKRLASHVADLFVFFLFLLVLILFAGYIFGALHMFGQSPSNRTSPQTLLVLTLLTAATFNRRAEYGVFSILLGIGNGSKIARATTPIALSLPFILAFSRESLAKAGGVNEQYATTITTALVAMLVFVLILVLAWRIEDLEKGIRDLSLRDGLTELYNRRGFFILAEQAVRLAQRSRMPFSVLFIDLDNLKKTNDALGHDAGSEFLREVANLLMDTFRETDVIGRVGGDEFVVAGESSAAEMRLLVQRLEEATERLNTQPQRIYPVSFSFGTVTATPGEQQSLEDMVSQADKAMYAVKMLKKMAL